MDGACGVAPIQNCIATYVLIYDIDHLQPLDSSTEPERHWLCLSPVLKDNACHRQLQ